MSNMDSSESGDGALNIDFMMSLQNIASAKIVTTLWMTPRSRRVIVSQERSSTTREQAMKSRSSTTRKQAMKSVAALVPELSLPKSLTERLTSIVPFVGDALFDWIQNHDRCVYSSKIPSTYPAIDYISYLKWSTRGRVDYAATAKNILTNESETLSDRMKYIIACTYCLEDEIAAMAPRFESYPFFHQHINPMIYFWSERYATDESSDDSEIFECLRKNKPSYKNIFLILTDSYYSFLNHDPYRYFWSNLSEKEKNNHFFNLVELENSDLCLSLLKNLSYDQQLQVLTSKTFHTNSSILCRMLDDWLWQDQFLTVSFQLLGAMKPEFFSLVFNHVVDKLNDRHVLNKSQKSKFKFFIKQLWEKAPFHLKEGIIGNQFNLSITRVLFSLSWEKDLDIIELVFKDLSLQQKKKIIVSPLGFDYCSDLIFYNKWNKMEVILGYYANNAILSKEDIDKLKLDLIRTRGVDLVRLFISNKRFDVLKHFIDWFFQSEEEVKLYERYLKPYVELKVSK